MRYSAFEVRSEVFDGFNFYNRKNVSVNASNNVVQIPIEAIESKFSEIRRTVKIIHMSNERDIS